jgi:hypothetical protein
MKKNIAIVVSRLRRASGSLFMRSRMVHAESQTAREGVALVITLAAVVLLTVLVLAFFSKSLINRQISLASSNFVKTGMLTQTAQDWLIGEMREEIRNGSTVATTTPVASGVTIYTPTTSAQMVPVRSNFGEYNLLRISSSGPPTVASTAPYALTASGVAASQPGQDNRYVATTRWDKIQLRGADTSAATEPQWVLITRAGVPSGGTVTPAQAGNKADTANYVVGRFAYAVYDEGGLLNANVAGSPDVNVTPADQGRKSSVALADLTAVGFADESLPDWRNATTNNSNSPASPNPYVNYIVGQGAVYGHTGTAAGASAAINGFNTVAAGDNTFLNRQDLIAFLPALNLPTAPLLYLGTSSYEQNSPSMAAINSGVSGTTAATNPDFSTLISPAPPNGTGKPLQRFPLSRLALLQQDPSNLSVTDKANILKYFGLSPLMITTLTGSKASATYRAWTYRSTTIGTCADAINGAGGNTPREPDLFELVHGAINNGGLGVDTQPCPGSSPAVSLSNESPGNIVDQDPSYPSGGPYSAETSASVHVARIVANLIDQYGSDNYPTTIVLVDSSLTPSSAIPVYGIKHLPYFSQMIIKAIFPRGMSTSATGATVNMYFQLWDPHQGTPPATGPSALRIMATGISYALGYNSTTANHKQSIFDRNQVVSSTASTITPSFPSGPSAAISVPYSLSNTTYSSPTINTSTSTYFTLANQAQASPQAVYSATATGAWDTMYFSAVKLTLDLQYQDASGNWHPYTTFGGYDSMSAPSLTNLSIGDIVYDWAGDSFKDSTVANADMALVFPDPRTYRYRCGQVRAGEFTPGDTMVPGADPGVGAGVREHFSASWPNGTPTLNPVGVFGDAGSAFMGMAYRNSGNNSSAASVGLQDADTKARVGDGYLGTSATPANPMAQTGAATTSAARPIMLNRPFRSVGELGYVFRDSPWKSMNFFSSDSADAGLMDLFSISDGNVVVGRTSLNTAQPLVLQALLQGTTTQDATNATVLPLSAGSTGQANTLANEVTGQTKTTSTTPNALANISALVQLPKYGSTTVDGNYLAIKTQREAVARALATGTQTRTWNLLVDMIVQSGKYPAGTGSLNNFVEDGERHYWLHVAVDRYTGEVLKTQLEGVNE